MLSPGSTVTPLRTNQNSFTAGTQHSNPIWARLPALFLMEGLAKAHSPRLGLCIWHRPDLGFYFLEDAV